MSLKAKVAVLQQELSLAAELDAERNAFLDRYATVTRPLHVCDRYFPHPGRVSVRPTAL